VSVPIVRDRLSGEWVRWLGAWKAWRFGQLAPEHVYVRTLTVPCGACSGRGFTEERVRRVTGGGGWVIRVRCPHCLGAGAV
jgi:hypothetical protein